MKSLNLSFRAAALACGLLLAHAAHAAPPPWRELDARAIPLAGPRLIQPLKSRTFEMAPETLNAILSRAPTVGVTGVRMPTLRLPLPEGGELTFRLVQTAVMQPGLAAKFPQIRTYAGSAVGNAAITGRFQIDPRGFRAMVFTPRGSFYIDPYSRGDNRHYQVYYGHDLPARRRAPDTVMPGGATKSGSAAQSSAKLARAKNGASISSELRTYRVAIGATYEYSSFHDPVLPPEFPDKAVVLAELVNVVNRVSGVYERDLGIRLELIDGNEAAIYTTPVQPYQDQAGPAMFYTNTTILNENVGEANYDIGHVASTGGGGVAGLGVVCGSNKGAGVTGLPEPVGDAYYIDFVAHEMGHQFGANHTYNGDEATNCGPNRNAGTAYEPGSGVAIMGYAGVCGAQNLAPHSIDTFHGASFDEIVEYTRNGEGDTCPVKTVVANAPPRADAGVGGFTIPKQTPFELTGAGCDADVLGPDEIGLTYQWEEFDLGPASAPNAAATTTGPIFRNFPPTPSPTRVFPQPSDLLGNTQTLGEILPNANREMKFRLTVRDNRIAPLSGGVASDDLRFMVTTSAGPFLVTAPNSAASYTGRQSLPVTWDVAGTDAAPVSCDSVNILMSSDGGNSFPVTLASDVANDGAQDVQLPNGATTQGRIKVKCANSIFFDVSNADFTIVPVVENTAPTSSLGVAPASVVSGGTVQFTITVEDEQGDALAWDLDFGDGSAHATGTVGATLGHAYSGAGNVYEAVLTVRETATDPALSGTPNRVSVTVTDGTAGGGTISTALTASPTSGDVTNGPLLVNFTATSTDSDAAGGALRYTFYYGDGTHSSRQSEPVSTHSYALAGSYRAVVVVANEKESSTTSQPVTITTTSTVVVDPVDEPIVAALSFTLDQSMAPARAVFDGSGSTAPAGAIYAFDFGDGSVVRSGTAKIVEHSYITAGTFTATLTVTDAADSSRTSTATATVTVTAVQATTAQLAISPARVFVGQAVNFDATSSVPAPGRQILGYRFDFADGSVVERTVAEFGAEAGRFSHAYTAAGSYQPSVTVTDDSQATAVARAQVKVDSAGVGEWVRGRAGGAFGLLGLLPLFGIAALRRRRR